MIRYIGILVIVFASFGTIYGQDPLLQEGKITTEEKARELTEKYQPELVMTGTQTRLFERKLSEFLIRAEKIKKLDITTEDKLHMLRQLSAQENEEMANILTRPQVKRYVKIKTELQPVAMVVDSLSKKEP
ncbi:hypothetical protein RQM65_17955 [Pricia sp. S334]|uniref:Periplasmic heavy metal sensor n=1 Tax=Pricia mediterranea TaxID=3076079 RepID=A0ABU3LBF5_9FLAO|nr:hypothetical protein [Pricia sp. S334]MDT7830558.1 hypothetical protein [Pricia sp. S334]